MGYYCIYQVPWIGWDLFEPLTYSIAQGYFMCGVYFYLKNKQETNYKNLADFMNNYYKNKIYKKQNFEPERLDFMRTQLQETEAKIDEQEQKKKF